jgi:hypothetical protein
MIRRAKRYIAARARTIGEEGRFQMNITERLRHISSEEFAALGVQGIAYVKDVTVNGAHLVAIHAADGTQLAVVPSRDVALATVRQNELEPASVH